MSRKRFKTHRRISQNHIKQFALYLLCFVVSVGAVQPIKAYAEETEKKKVRVGWYESAFHQTDQFDRRSGYGYEYQQKVLTYTNWEYEYVDGSWTELLDMLFNGEIDLLSDVSYTEERAEKILYSANSMGSENYHAFILRDNSEIDHDDFSTFNGKRIGVNKNSIQQHLLLEWIEEQNIHPEVVELTGKSPELFEMLRKGEIDILVTLEAYGNNIDDILPVCKIGSSDFFFGINKQRPDIKKDLDIAMNHIFENNKFFNQQMAEKFTPNRGISDYLANEEIAWLNDHGTIRMGYRTSYLPFCGLSTETLLPTGALTDFLTFAASCEKNAALSFDPSAYRTTEEALSALDKGEIDCLFPVNLSTYDAEELGVSVTDPLISTEMYTIVSSAKQKEISRDKELVVALSKGNPSYEVFLMDNFPNWSWQYYDDQTSAFKAVASGEADCILVSSYRLNDISDLCDKYKMATLATGKSLALSFAVKGENEELCSILNKIIRIIPETTINSWLTSYSVKNHQITFWDYLHDNLLMVIIEVVLIALAITLLLIKNRSVSAKAKEGRMIISEAERDSLTCLYNRNFFIVYANRLQSEQSDKPMDAIVLNIEKFHTLNTLNGHEFGNKVLCALADEINDYVEKCGGIASRINGDHFDIYCPHLDDYQPLYDRFQNKMDNFTSNTDIRLRMGVMPYQNDLMPEQMFDRALTACSKIQGNYKTNIMVYDDELLKRDELNQRLLGDMRRAIEDHEFLVYYQPKYDIQSKPPKLSSAEALVRWKHHELGMISPGVFIPLFEQSGQISKLDKYVWAETAKQIAIWRDKYGFTLPVSVNLSRIDVFDPNLFDTLDGLIHKHGLDRANLKLEVTESAYTEDADHLILVIGQLREKGYKIEMDDFGSGYSSLNMLSSMPIDVLKMDMAFVRNIEHSEQDFHLVELIIDIAQYLKVPVIAEGVETENQLVLLRDAGCSMVQGYYFSRPLPAEEFEKTILATETSA